MTQSSYIETIQSPICAPSACILKRRKGALAAQAAAKSSLSCRNSGGGRDRAKDRTDVLCFGGDGLGPHRALALGTPHDPGGEDTPQKPGPRMM